MPEQFTEGSHLFVFERTYKVELVHYLACIFVVVVFGLIGRSIGLAQAFHLKLEAQTALCAVATEANTRGPAPRFEEPTGPTFGAPSRV